MGENKRSDLMLRIRINFTATEKAIWERLLEALKLETHGELVRTLLKCFVAYTLTQTSGKYGSSLAKQLEPHLASFRETLTDAKPNRNDHQTSADTEETGEGVDFGDVIEEVDSHFSSVDDNQVEEIDSHFSCVDDKQDEQKYSTADIQDNNTESSAVDIQDNDTDFHADNDNVEIKNLPRLRRKRKKPARYQEEEFLYSEEEEKLSSPSERGQNIDPVIIEPICLETNKSVVSNLQQSSAKSESNETRWKSLCWPAVVKLSRCDKQMNQWNENCSERRKEMEKYDIVPNSQSSKSMNVGKYVDSESGIDDENEGQESYLTPDSINNEKDKVSEETRNENQSISPDMSKRRRVMRVETESREEVTEKENGTPSLKKTGMVDGNRSENEKEKIEVDISDDDPDFDPDVDTENNPEPGSSDEDVVLLKQEAGKRKSAPKLQSRKKQTNQEVDLEEEKEPVEADISDGDPEWAPNAEPDKEQESSDQDAMPIKKEAVKTKAEKKSAQKVRKRIKRTNKELKALRGKILKPAFPGKLCIRCAQYIGLENWESHLEECPVPQKPRVWYTCLLCKKQIMIKNHNKHLGTSACRDDRRECSICGKTLNCDRALNSHMADCHGEPEQCKICKTTCPSHRRLVYHMRWVHNKHSAKRKHTPTTCDICGQIFVSKERMNMHKKRVHVERKYKCETCQRPFKTKHSLQQHERLHNGDRPFMCHRCPYKSTQKTALNSHIMNHHFEDYVEPKIKQIVINPTGEEIKADRSKGQGIRCRDCNEYFGWYKDYTHHRYVVHGLDKVTCVQCGYDGPDKNKVVRHVVDAHSGGEIIVSKGVKSKNKPIKVKVPQKKQTECKDADGQSVKSKKKSDGTKNKQVSDSTKKKQAKKKKKDVDSKDDSVTLHGPPGSLVTGVSSAQRKDGNMILKSEPLSSNQNISGNVVGDKPQTTNACVTSPGISNSTQKVNVLSSSKSIGKDQQVIFRLLSKPLTKPSPVRLVSSIDKNQAKPISLNYREPAEYITSLTNNQSASKSLTGVQSILSGIQTIAGSVNTPTITLSEAQTRYLLAGAQQTSTIVGNDTHVNSSQGTGGKPSTNIVYLLNPQSTTHSSEAKSQTKEATLPQRPVDKPPDHVIYITPSIIADPMTEVEITSSNNITTEPELVEIEPVDDSHDQPEEVEVTFVSDEIV